MNLPENGKDDKKSTPVVSTPKVVATNNKPNVRFVLFCTLF